LQLINYPLILSPTMNDITFGVQISSPVNKLITVYWVPILPPFCLNGHGSQRLNTNTSSFFGCLSKTDSTLGIYCKQHILCFALGGKSSSEWSPLPQQPRSPNPNPTRNPKIRQPPPPPAGGGDLPPAMVPLPNNPNL
jgi:hypothetical protein